MINRVIKFFLENKLITTILLLAFIAWGLLTSPFAWNLGDLPTDKIHVDVFHLRVFLQRVGTQLMSRTAHLVSAERGICIQQVIVIDPDGAGA